MTTAIRVHTNPHRCLLKNTSTRGASGSASLYLQLHPRLHLHNDCISQAPAITLLSSVQPRLHHLITSSSQARAITVIYLHLRRLRRLLQTSTRQPLMRNLFRDWSLELTWSTLPRQLSLVGNKPHELAGAREEAHNPGIPQHTTLGIHSSHTKS